MRKREERDERWKMKCLSMYVIKMKREKRRKFSVLILKDDNAENGISVLIYEEMRY